MRKFRASITLLSNAGFHPDVQKAVDAWESTPNPGVLIGGVAMSFYTRPRYTQDVDVLYLSLSDSPSSVPGFKKHRVGAFEHPSTGVEVEVTNPETFRLLPKEVAQRVIETAVSVGSSGFKVASREGMIALKLFSSQEPRRVHKDLADVVSLLELHTNLDMSVWNLPSELQAVLDDCRKKAS